MSTRSPAADIVGRPRPELGRATVAALLCLAFLLRLTFGLVSDFWGEDERQIYLIGLKYYTTGTWPLYGPDVVYTETQIPGGLQGLLVGGPLWMVAAPEAPYVLLNVLSFGVLLLLGWYIGRRLPDVPRWFLWPSMFFSPWTLDLSTHVINTSYVLIGSVLFFVSALELAPVTRAGVVPRSVAFFGLGFGLLWIYQVHLSAAVLAPIALGVIVLAGRDDLPGTARGLGWCVLGAMVAGATLLPTLLAAGVTGVAGRTGANMVFAPENLLRLPQVVLQFLSFGSFELPRFLGSGTAERLAFLARYLWAAPFVAFAAVCGIAQTAVLLAGLLTSRSDQRGWPAIRGATIGLLVLVFLSFTLSVKPPASHAFYAVTPIVLIFAFYRWDVLLRRRAVRVVAMALVVSGLVTHVAIAMRNFTDRSLYTNRALVVQAIQEKNHRLVGERRSDIWQPQ